MTNAVGPMTRFAEWVNSRPLPQRYAAGYASLLAIAFIDYYTGPSVFFLSLYIGPIFFLTWFIGRNAGMACAAASMVCWFVVNGLLPQPAYQKWFYHLNVVFKVSSLFAFCYLLAEMKLVIQRESITARTDFLTGISNRLYFYEIANMEISKAARFKRAFTVAYMDIDDFKVVNDRFGHGSGNSLLKVIGATCRRHLRTSDVVARVGGDEFAFLLPETGAEPCHIAVQRLQQQLLASVSGTPWPVTFSIGVVTFQDAPADVDQMMGLIDQAMYAAKNAGKNRTHYAVYNAPVKQAPAAGAETAA